MMLFIAGLSVAQRNQVGLHAGAYSGINYRYCFKDNAISAELEKGKKQGVLFSLGMQRIVKLCDRWSLYGGAGVFFSYFQYTGNYTYRDEVRTYTYWEPGWGIKTAVGADYKTGSLPLYVGADIKHRFYELRASYCLEPGVHVRLAF